MASCELCGEQYELKPGRGANNRISCYTCTDKPETRSRHYRNKHLKRAYGLTLFEFDSMYEAQQGCCKICGNEIAAVGHNLRNKNNRPQNDPCVDHCHTTGKVRGLLCFHCNTALGHVFDSQEVLSKMIAYLANDNGI